MKKRIRAVSVIISAMLVAAGVCGCGSTASAPMEEGALTDDPDEGNFE